MKNKVNVKVELNVLPEWDGIAIKNLIVDIIDKHHSVDKNYHEPVDLEPFDLDSKIVAFNFFWPADPNLKHSNYPSKYIKGVYKSDTGVYKAHVYSSKSPIVHKKTKSGYSYTTQYGNKQSKDSKKFFNMIEDFVDNDTI